ncbi:accessory factor UbiK family protein [Betaproteobacteria bacterium PRO4]|uniref:accessory factor UbiK family protein n=1 Tax=Nitrosomonas sp. TaxID=42353 RepID=UPI0025658FD4|nr:accessory factor UbiK family protein [Nitrosomonas sp.]MBE7527229.1 accessory factor UbiK family protein [Burkholderiales bacterium]MDL1866171.1 accessory factor UbiK family protein [Betaproteobacteria bacterium PRO4]
MLNKNVLDEIGSKVNEILGSSPAKDVEKNMRAMLTGAFSKLDLVTREEFDVQQEVVKRTRIKLAELEEKVRKLEQQLNPPAEIAASGEAGETSSSYTQQ